MRRVNPTQDTRNQATWTRPEVGSYFSSLDGFSDVGEKAALQRVRERMEGGPILDLGIGAGRTTSLLQAISPDYLGIDYLPSMVKLAQANHPGARVQTKLLSAAMASQRVAPLVIWAWNMPWTMEARRAAGMPLPDTSPTTK